MKFILLLLIVLVLAPGLAFADQADVPRVRWFTEFGVGVEVGLASLEDAASSGFLGFTHGWGLGPDLKLGILRHENHRVHLGAGYLYLGPKRTGGTVQVAVANSYQRVDIAAAYNYLWKILIIGLEVGSAMTIVNTKTIYRDVSYTIEGEEIHFGIDSIYDKAEHLGVEFGLLIGTCIGVDMGQYIFKQTTRPMRLEILAKADYTRRGERDAFFAGAGLVFWLD